MTKSKNFPYLALLVLISLLVLSLFFTQTSDVVLPKLPDKQEYPFLYFVGFFTQISFFTSGLINFTFERVSFLVILLGSLFFLFQYWKEKNREYLLWLLYLSILICLKLIISLEKIFLSILEIPFVILIHVGMISYLISSFSQVEFSLKKVLDIFKNSYGKTFFFLYLLSMGPEALPFDELGMYVERFGEKRAWEIIIYRNLFFDILFFPLLWGYLLWIVKKSNLSFLNSFLQLNEILKTTKKIIFLLGFKYYTIIFLFTLIGYFYLEIKYLVIFFPILYILTLREFYKKIFRQVV
jgi:hypothetical protein